MPLRICFPLNGHQVCINIPVLLPNPPGPDPDPWLHGLEIPMQELGQLQQLSAVASIVEKMPAAMQQVLVAPVERAIEAQAKKVNGAVIDWHRGRPGPDPATSHR